MFGFVTADPSQLTKEERTRYGSVYCGICRQIRQYSSQFARFSLSYDMAFLALLLMSLYEPEELKGKRACALHPVHPRPWVDNEFVRYAAQMNIALAYYKALDDIRDENRCGAKLAANVLEKDMPAIVSAFPRQCKAIETCIRELDRLEAEGCENPDTPAHCFGDLMAELLVYHDDIWAGYLRKLGSALGRYIYLADAAVDYRKDRKKHCYNPYLAMGMDENWDTWRMYLSMALGSCTDAFEALPLVQDKSILDNILYSGIWLQYRKAQKKFSPGGTTNE